MNLQYTYSAFICKTSTCQHVSSGKCWVHLSEKSSSAKKSSSSDYLAHVKLWLGTEEILAAYGDQICPNFS